MPIRTSLNVSLTPDQEREGAQEAAVAELRAKIRGGSEQTDRGEFPDGDIVFEEIPESSSRRRAEIGK